MKAKELIELLLKLPDDCPVFLQEKLDHLVKGCAEIDTVYLVKFGAVISKKEVRSE